MRCGRILFWMRRRMNRFCLSCCHPPFTRIPKTIALTMPCSFFFPGHSWGWPFSDHLENFSTSKYQQKKGLDPLFGDIRSSNGCSQSEPDQGSTEGFAPEPVEAGRPWRGRFLWRPIWWPFSMQLNNIGPEKGCFYGCNRRYTKEGLQNVTEPLNPLVCQVRWIPRLNHWRPGFLRVSFTCDITLHGQTANLTIPNSRNCMSSPPL